MPCRLCGTRSEDYPKPAIFTTPLMPIAIPNFNASTDFLCPRCFRVYFEAIELKYGSRMKIYYQVFSDEFHYSSPPPPPPPPSRTPHEPRLNNTAYSAAYAPDFAKISSILSNIWDFSLMFAGLDSDSDESPAVSSRVRPPTHTRLVRHFRPPLTPHAVALPRREPIDLPPIIASATITVDFPIEESKAYLRRQRDTT